MPLAALFSVTLLTLTDSKPGGTEEAEKCKLEVSSEAPDSDVAAGSQVACKLNIVVIAGLSSKACDKSVFSFKIFP
ncbi:MAG: hypothetical protein WC632_04655 [Candidatus Margulisiibacteriota bacterium]